jgi:hypothetical protein
MSELAVGPDLDRALAKACGFAAKLRAHKGKWAVSIGRTCGSLELTWRPSTELNAAFEAAEKAGLFVFGDGDEGSRFLDRVIDGGIERWRVCAHYYVDEDTPDQRIKIRVIETGSTPAEAICRAILALEDR